MSLPFACLLLCFVAAEFYLATFGYNCAKQGNNSRNVYGNTRVLYIILRPLLYKLYVLARLIIPVALEILLLAQQFFFHVRLL